MELQQQHQHHTTLDVPPLTGSPPQVGGEGRSKPAGDAPHVADGKGGYEHSVGTQDLQNMRLVVDIGDGRTIEIPLKGNLVLQQQNGSSAPQAAPAAAGGNDGEEYLDKIQGWLMTVATLFISIAFQAAMQRPSWMPDNWFTVFRRMDASSGTPPTMFAPSSSPTAATAAATIITRGQAIRAHIYVYCNTITFATSLTVVLVLLATKKSQPSANTTSNVKVLMLVVCVAVGCTFAAGNSYGPSFSSWRVAIIVLAAVFVVFYYVISWTRCIRRLAAFCGLRAN